MTNYWKDAPDGAVYIGWDCDGWAYYYKSKPTWEFDEFTPNHWEVSKQCPENNNINKAGQLEKRPEDAQ